MSYYIMTLVSVSSVTLLLNPHIPEVHTGDFNSHMGTDFNTDINVAEHHDSHKPAGKRQMRWMHTFGHISIRAYGVLCGGYPLIAHPIFA